MKGETGQEDCAEKWTCGVDQAIDWPQLLVRVLQIFLLPPATVLARVMDGPVATHRWPSHAGARLVRFHRGIP